MNIRSPKEGQGENMGTTLNRKVFSFKFFKIIAIILFVIAFVMGAIAVSIFVVNKITAPIYHQATVHTTFNQSRWFVESEGSHLCLSRDEGPLLIDIGCLPIQGEGTFLERLTNTIKLIVENGKVNPTRFPHDKLLEELLPLLDDLIAEMLLK